MRRPRAARPHVGRSAFAGFRFPPEVITVAVRWYLRYGLSYRDVEELLAERGIHVDHVTVYRWVQRFPPLFVDAARPTRQATGDRWSWTRPTSRVAGRWRYLYRAVDQHGQVIDVLLSEQRDTAAAHRFFTRALLHGPVPVEVTTDQAGPYLRVLADLVPTAAHVTEQYCNNRIEADHARLKAQLHPAHFRLRVRVTKLRYQLTRLETGSGPLHESHEILTSPCREPPPGAGGERPDQAAIRRGPSALGWEDPARRGSRHAVALGLLLWARVARTAYVGGLACPGGSVHGKDASWWRRFPTR